MRVLAGLAASALLLAGCSGDGEAEPPTSAPTTHTASSAADLTADQRERIDAWLEQWVSGWEADPRAAAPMVRPEVDIIRLVGEADWGQVIAECLTEAGFTSSATSDGVYESSEMTADQVGSYHQAEYACYVQYPLDPDQDRTNLTEAQEESAISYLTVTLVECLAGEGYAITDIPSGQALREQGWMSWSPYHQLQPTLDGLGRAEFDRLLEACPANPPPEVLWGE